MNGVLNPGDRGSYRPLDKANKPPWQKKVYGDPESDDSRAAPRGGRDFRESRRAGG